MTTDNDFNEKLAEISEKINTIEPIKEVDIIEIKNTLETIEKQISAVPVAQSDSSELKNSLEDFQKQQLELTVKNNDNVRQDINEIKETATTIQNKTEDAVKDLKNKLEDLHTNLKDYIAQIVVKYEGVPTISEIGGVVSDITGMQQKNIKQMNTLLQDMLSAFEKLDKEFRDQEFEVQAAKIADIYNGLVSLNDWVEKVGYINQSIENVYARLGENADFDDIAEKVDIMYDNITALNKWIQKIDNIETSLAEVKSVTDKNNDGNETINNKIGSIDESFCEVREKLMRISSFPDDIKNTLDMMTSVKEQIGRIFEPEPDFEDITAKVDIIYENLSAMNEWANKADAVSKQIDDLKDVVENSGNLIKKSDEISGKIDNLSNKTAEDNLPEKIQKAEEKIDSLTGKTDHLTEKVENVSKTIEEGNIVSKLDNVADSINAMKASFEDDMVFSKIDLMYENLGVLNEWFDKINNLGLKSEELESKLGEINQSIDRLYDMTGAIPEVGDRISALQNELHTITRKTKDGTDTYVYTLLDIESDFLKLNKTLEENTHATSQGLIDLKECFTDITQDIASISIRTNKLILSADDANRELYENIGTLKDTIEDFKIQKGEMNPLDRFDYIDKKLTENAELIEKNIVSSENINGALSYVADWIDRTTEDLALLHEKSEEIKAVQTKQLETKYAKEETLKDLRSETINIGANLKAAVEKAIEEIQSRAEREEALDGIKMIVDGLSSFETGIANIMETTTKSLRLTERASQDIMETVQSVNVTRKNAEFIFKQNKGLVDELRSIKNSLIQIGENAKFETTDTKSNLKLFSDRLSRLEAVLSEFRAEDMTELKSVISGITMQLNTSLRPDIDALDEKIDKASDINNKKYEEFENFISEKIAKQERQIASLENKLDKLCSKFDRLADATEIIGNADEIRETAERVAKMSRDLAGVTEKVNGFNKSITKLVSYIEEE